MNRVEKLIGNVGKTAKVIEIGALCRPLLKKSNFHVFYVDYASREFLIDRYKNDPNVVLEDIVEVDGIWGDKTLSEATHLFSPVDFIVASHVIEHVPNLIEWFNELASILKDDGHLNLAIPDQRYTFDFLRRSTHISDVLDSYFQGRRTPSVREVFDHLMNFCHVHPADAWSNKYPLQDIGERLSWDQIKELAHSINYDNAYHDVHCLIFTPLTFTNLMIDLAKYKLHEFSCEDFFDTQYGDMEFIVRLKKDKNNDQVLQSWYEIKKKLMQRDASDLLNKDRHNQSYCLKNLVMASKKHVPMPIKRVIKRILSLFS